MSGNLLALGAVGALVLAGASKRGARALDPVMSRLVPEDATDVEGGVWRADFKIGTCWVELRPGHEPNEVELANLSAEQIGVGAGGRALRTLTRKADEEKITIVLEREATPFEEEDYDDADDRVRELYERHGFVPREGHGRTHMIRRPR